MLLRTEQSRLLLELPNTFAHFVGADARCCEIRTRRIEADMWLVERLEGDAQKLAGVVWKCDATFQGGLQEVRPGFDWSCVVATSQHQVPFVGKQQGTPPAL